MIVRPAILAAFLAAALPAVAQVSYVTVDKTKIYDQNSATTVVPKPVTNPCGFNCPFAFSARVGTVSGGSGISAPSITGPINSAALGSRWNGGVFGLNSGYPEWQLGNPPGGEFDYGTQAELDANFGSGLYTITAGGTAYPLHLSGDSYPSPAVVNITGFGTWTDGKFVFDPRQPLTLSTPPAPFGSSGGLVGLYGCRQNLPTCPFGVGGDPSSITIPANTFADGEEPFFVATFTQFVDHTAAAGAPTTWASYNARTQVTLKAQIPQPFPLTVNANITPTVSTVTATMQFQAQDVGTTGSVYSFFVAPKTKVANAAIMEKGASLGGMMAKSHEKAVAVECVLAQLNQSGQLQAVSAANLQAYVTGVLSGQGQVVSMVNNLPTATIAGTTLYVGYGADPLAMITKGTNRRATQVPGDIQCDPQAPETGWWWNKAEGGRGYSIEVAGNHIFFAAYLYDTNGRATWYTASGPVWLDNSVFPGNLEAYSGGQTLAGTYKAPAAAVLNGPITLAFTDAQTGTMTWPGGSVALQRFEIVPGGLKMSAFNNQPEGGWWWNPAESGRGYFLEWQGGQLFMAGYMYDDAGNPVWYLSSNVSTNLQSYSGVWAQYGNGQTLMGAFKPASTVNANVGPVSIQFSGTENAVMTLPGGRTTAIRRFRF